MKNRAHRGESKERRLRRLQEGPPVEAIDTLLNSIDNFFNNEIRITPERNQSSLLFLGIHASALTIAEAFWGRGDLLERYRMFLRMFVDGGTKDTRFSEIAQFIHDWRNVLAHQWIGSIGHDIEYDYDMGSGWERRDGIVAINPRIYCERYIEAFSGTGRIWDYERMFSEAELENIKERIIRKYEER